MNQERPDPLIGNEIAGKYRVISLIASGGMGRVYRAEQLPLGRIVALKILHSGRIGGSGDNSSTGQDSAVQEKRFLREASILAKLTHPSIVTIFDYGSLEAEGDDGSGPTRRFFMAMEYVAGQTLQQRITQRGALSPEETIRFALQTARGLREAHALGIVHRDLKPLNLMLTPDRDGIEQVKILDFGIVKLMAEEGLAAADNAEVAELTQEGLFVGSPMYMAPEQIETGKVDARSDVYSLGVVLYRCLAGSLPFPPGSSMQIMMAHIREQPTPLLSKAPDVPPWLADLVHRCLEKEPAKRPQSMDDLVREFSTTSDGQITAAGRASSVVRLDSTGAFPPSGREHTGNATVSAAMTSLPAIPVEPKRKSPMIWVAIAGVALVAGVAVVVLGGDKAKPTTAAGTGEKSAKPEATGKKSFLVIVDSSPSGAELYEGDKKLGNTPMQLTVENDSVKASPRTFTVKKDGYLSYTLSQGPSEETVRMVVPLGVSPAAAASSAATTPPVVASASVPTPSKPTAYVPTAKPVASAKPTSDIDISLKR